MTAVVTSPHSAGTWAHFGAFLRRPELPARATGMRASALPALGKLFALDLLVMAGLLGLLGLLVALGLELPGHMLDSMELDAWLLAFMLLGAPIGEEIIFRGWLSGRPGHVAAILALVVAGAGAALAVLSEAPLGAAAGWAALVFGLALAPFVLWRKRRRPAMPWFQRHFRWLYLLSTIAFASVHLTNFTDGAAAILLPLTLPQFALGLILGYARVQFGLWSSVLLHMGHNALFVGLLLAGGS